MNTINFKVRRTRINIRKEADMRVVKLILISIITLLIATQIIMANQEDETEKSLGEKLLCKLWSDMEKQDLEAIEKTISQGFQSVH